MSDRISNPGSHSAVESALRDPGARFHFVGVGGTGMSALAQYRAFAKAKVSGSDRSFDQGLMVEERQSLERLGVTLHTQDGSGVDGAAVVVISTAIEASIPDIAKAKALGLPILHRADLLAMHVAGPSMAIAGTSGKSTVTAMAFEILRAAGRDPGLITGGRILGLMRQGHYGNAWHGSGPVVVEADESDGSLVKHAPQTGVLLNLHRDHMEPSLVLEQFRTFRNRVRGEFAVSDDPELFEFQPGALVFGFSDDADVRGTDVRQGRDGARFTIDGVEFFVPHPGLHNVWNAIAATAAARAIGIPLEVAAGALAEFSGVHRRFEIVGNAGGVEVVDDFAHNPQKVAAVIEAAKARSRRVIACFQPHGFQPMRFLRDELTRAFASALREDDEIHFAPIFFAGGTVAKDISSEMLIDDIRRLGAKHAFVAKEREGFVDYVARNATEGDVVLVLGARDPTLPSFARAIAAALEK